MKASTVFSVLALAGLLLITATGCGEAARSDAPSLFERSAAEPLPPFITVNGSEMTTDGLIRVTGGPNLTGSGDFKAGMFTTYLQASGSIVLTYSLTAATGHITHYVSVAPSGSISISATPPSPK